MALACNLLVAFCCLGLAASSAPSASGWSYGAGAGAGLDYASRWYGPVAIPVVLPDGTLANTPEVAAARTQHLVALNKAKALWYGYGGSGSSGYGGSYGSGGWRSGSPPGAWPSSSASSSGGWPSSASPSGGWQSSSTSSSGGWPSSSASSSGGWPSSAASSWPSSGGSGWTGPEALPSVLSSGHLADTPSVAAAKAAHLGALAKAQLEAEKWKPQGHGWS